MVIARMAIKSTALFLLGSLLIPSISSGGYDEGARALMQGDYATALNELRTTSDEGDPRAQVLLGNMYRNGLGVSKDASLAAHWYRSAAEQGLPQAQYSLASMYRKGAGVPKDYSEAAKWYRKSAEQNLSAGQTSLGAAYFYGHGVPQDYVQAHMWFSLALSGVSVRASDLNLAKKGIELCESKMTLEQIKEAKHLAQRWKTISE